MTNPGNCDNIISEREKESKNMKDVYQRARCKKGYARRDMSNKWTRANVKQNFLKEIKKGLDK